MKHGFIVVLLLILNSDCLAQKEGNVWIFGDSAGIDFNTPVATPIFSAMDEFGSCASVADTTGNLMFYCFSKYGVGDTATYVFNYLNDTMLNGENLIGVNLHNQIILIPVPNENKKYYIFHLGFYAADGLYYSMVDMNLNGGMGEVIQKNIQINNFLQGDCISAIRHGNGRDWWLITKLGGNGSTSVNRFFVFLVSPSVSGFTPIIQDFGNSIDAVKQRLVINHRGNKFININVAGLMAEYNFDRCSGTISNQTIIFTEQSSNYSRFYWEGTYSPNDSVFYTTTNWVSFPNDTSRLLQFNLFVPNIPASCDTLFEQRNPNIFGAIRLAPNNKIYMTNYYNWGFPGFPYPDSVRNVYNENLSVVNNPNIAGSGCNFAPFSFYLGGKRTYAGLPNNPNYSLGRWIGSPCDTLGVGINEIEIKNEAALFVFYHPTWQKAFINAQHLKGKKFTLRVHDALAKEVYKETGKLNTEYFTKDLGCVDLAKGVYVVSLTTEKEKLVKRFVKE